MRRRLAAGVVLLLGLAGVLPAAAQESNGPTNVFDRVLSDVVSGGDLGGMVVDGEVRHFQFVANLSSAPSFKPTGVDLEFLGVDSSGGVVSVAAAYTERVSTSRVPPLDPWRVVSDGTLDLPDGWTAYGEEGEMAGPVGPFESPSLVWGLELDAAFDPACPTAFSAGRAWLGEATGTPDPPWTADDLTNSLGALGELAGKSRMIRLSCVPGGAPRVSSSRMTEDLGIRPFGPLGATALVNGSSVVFISPARTTAADLDPFVFATGSDGSTRTAGSSGPVRALVPNPYVAYPVQLILGIVGGEASAGGGAILLSYQTETKDCPNDFISVFVERNKEIGSGVFYAQLGSFTGNFTLSETGVVQLEGTSPAGRTTTLKADADSGEASIRTEAPDGEVCEDAGQVDRLGEIRRDVDAWLSGETAPEQTPDQEDPVDFDQMLGSEEEDAVAPDPGASALLWALWTFVGFLLLTGLYWLFVRPRRYAYRADRWGDPEMVPPDPMVFTADDPVTDDGPYLVVEEPQEDASFEDPCWEQRRLLQGGEDRLRALEAELEGLDDPQSETFQALVQAIRTTRSSITAWAAELNRCEEQNR